MAQDKVIELKIFDGEKTLFEQGDNYVIPRYQRAYAWEEKEIIQLIDDINDIDINTGNNYYIGSLIVSRVKGKENTFEVVDGQQRLTTLFLVLQYMVHANLLDCGIGEQAISFDCRTKSNNTLDNIKSILNGNDKCDDEEKMREPSIIHGIKIIREKFEENDNLAQDFQRRLERVVLYRIEVPEHTDLNRYFEIMNTRGEQLEQHDIIKAKLMGFLEKYDAERELFAKIWNACSDMTGYVQMHFLPKERENIFGKQWHNIPADKWDNKCYKDCLNNKDCNGYNAKIKDIIDPNFKVNNVDGILDDGTHIRFDSIIDFPHFLLHTLRVFIKRRKTNIDLGNLLDDKKLITDFEKVIDESTANEEGEKAKFSRDFIVHLLQARYLFDKFIIKREYTGEDNEGEWSLKELGCSDKKPYYKNTVIKTPDEKTWWEKKSEKRNKECLMIQSALRVSYTSPKVMHWITSLLDWLFKNQDNLPYLIKEAEKTAAQAIYDGFIKDKNYKLGVLTPHIVFNYLDYLLWKGEYDDCQCKKNAKQKYSDFEFEFRNSVEHWYPQHPSDGSFDQWEEKDRFGNLCIISRNVNSKFSNLSPASKMKTYENLVNKGSIKLRIMGEIISRSNNSNSNENWRNEDCKQHENEMIEKLEKNIESLLQISTTA